jgi:hypothetical protein
MDLDFERKVLRGLHLEWELAVMGLPPSLRRQMPRPLFRLADIRALGLWSPGKREITIRRALAEAGPWDDVREVLRHETAHQLAAVIGGPDSTPHGPAFARACRLVGARPEATMRQIPLHARIAAQAQAPAGDPIRRRVGKLLALAESANPHEARAAMGKAQALMRRHQLERWSSAEEPDFLSAFLGAPSLRHPKEAYFLANLLQDFFFVEGIWVPAYALAQERMGRVLEVSGEAHHVEMAGYVHDYVRRFIARQWAEANGRDAGHGARRSDFAVGIIEGFRGQLAVPPQDPEPAGRLVVLRDPRLAGYVRQRHPRRRSISRGGGLRDEQAFDAGWRRGRRLILARGIARHDTSVARQLPPVVDPS